MSPPFSETLVQRLREADWVTVFTGAGMSAESGVPTFRGEGGIWETFRPEELASMKAFLRNPELVWRWYAHRREVMGAVSPNPGHTAVVRLERLYPGFAVITQNIDNLHRRAGSLTVYELHGNIERNYCAQCGEPYQLGAGEPADRLPRCTACGGAVRPDVIWFGEILPEDEWKGAVAAARSSDLFLSVGTSAVVYPAASLPVMARRAGAYLVEINPEPTPLTEVADEFLAGRAGEILPLLAEVAERLRESTMRTGGDRE